MARKLFKDFVQEISKELVYELYITQNKSVKECTSILNIGQTMFMRLIKYYGVKKPKDLHTQNIKSSKLEKYGDENYNNHEQTVRTNIERYGGVAPACNEEIHNKIIETFKQTYS